MSSDKNAKSSLRQRLRRARNALDQESRLANEVAISNTLLQSSTFHNSEHIAIYLANDGEVSLDRFLTAAIDAGKRCYLPCVDGEMLVFRLYDQKTQLKKNRFGISEAPESAPCIAARELDLVCMPLVAYDLNGGRLGMGGGFYDRCFSFKLNDRSASPALIGIAHSVQQVQNAPVEAFDVSIDGVVNERGLTVFGAID